ncbi:MAG: glycosyltransferase [Faecalibacterium sp.]
MPKLTIVVPVYNAAAYLEQCVHSILTQTFPNFTLLLINDGSTDQSGERCDFFAAQDTRIQVIHQENIGVEQTILKGIRLAATPYIGFVDSDDWLLPEMYQTMFNALVMHDSDMVQCGALINGITHSSALTSSQEAIITDAKKTYYRPYFETTADLAPLTNARWSKVYQTDLLQQAITTVPQGVSIGEDLLLNLAYLCQSKKAIVLADSAYYCYRSNANSLTLKYSDKKHTSILRLYTLLAELAKQEGFSDTAVVRQGKNETCALMLDVLLSALAISEKSNRLRELYIHLADRHHLLQYAKERPLVGRLALYFVSLRLFWLISATVSVVNSLTSKKE